MLDRRAMHAASAILLCQAPTNISFVSIDPNEAVLSPAVARASSQVLVFSVVSFLFGDVRFACKVAEDANHAFLLEFLATHCASMPTVYEMQAGCLVGAMDLICESRRQLTLKKVAKGKIAIVRGKNDSDVEAQLLKRRHA